MKRSVLNRLGELDGKSFGYIAELSYIYGNICVKADATSLLDLEVEEEGDTYKIENLAFVIVHEQEGDDDKIDLIPKNGDEDLPMLSSAVCEIHPEFIQSLEKLETEYDGERDEEGDEKIPFDIEEDDSAHLLRLTMPPVDEERKKLLTDSTNLAFDDCKAKLEAINTYYEVDITSRLAGATEQEVNFVKKMLEETKKKYAEMADQYKSEKLKEIDDAYRRNQMAVEASHTDGGEESSQWKTLKME